MTARKKVVQGGTSAGKTHGIIPILIDKAIKTPRLKITVVAETIPAVKDGAVDIFKQVMYDTNRWNDNQWIGNPMQYTYLNDSRIQFKAFDTPGKAKASGKRDIVFLNEANHISFEIADQLMTRSNEVWIDFNPDNEFWAHTETMLEPNSEFLLLTYRDNEAIPPQILEEINIKLAKAYYNPYGDRKDPSNIKSQYWHNWCKVYVDGEIGNLQGAIFDSWKQIDSVPAEAKLLRHGLDFGFSNDPMACISLFEWNNQLIVRENFYRTQMGISELVTALKKLERGDVICDSSQPLMIHELKKAGISAKPCIKGKDSVEYGIEKLNERDMLVTKGSINVIKEFRSYVRDPETNQPIDSYNHAADAIRYAYVSKGSTIKAKGMVV